MPHTIAAIRESIEQHIRDADTAGTPELRRMCLNLAAIDCELLAAVYRAL